MEPIHTTSDSCAAPCPADADIGSKDKGVGLFDREWEVFVIKRNAQTARYDWFTLCCEEAA